MLVSCSLDSASKTLTGGRAFDTAPSMFGRPLREQIAADGQPIPVIVSKCIEAVEAQGKSERMHTGLRLILPQLWITKEFIGRQEARVCPNSLHSCSREVNTTLSTFKTRIGSTTSIRSPRFSRTTSDNYPIRF